MKKLFLMIFIVMIVSIQSLTLIIYADTDPLTRTPCDTPEQRVAAFKAYMQFKNTKYKFDIDTQELVDVIVNFQYSQLKTFAKLANIDLEQLFADTYFTIKDNDILSFIYSNSGLEDMDALYFSMLDEYDIDINDVIDKEIYSGETITDDDGNSALVYYVDNNFNITNGSNSSFDTIQKWGTSLKYDSYDINNLASLNNNISVYFNFNGSLYGAIDDHEQSHNSWYNIHKRDWTSFGRGVCLTNFGYSSLVGFQSYPTLYVSPFTESYGYSCVVKQNNIYYIGFLSYQPSGSGSSSVSIQKNYVKYRGTRLYLDTANPPINHGAIVNIDKGAFMSDAVPNEIDTNKSSIEDYIKDNDADVTEPEVKPEQKPLPDDGTSNNNQPDLNTGASYDGKPFSFKMPELNIDWSLEGLDEKFPFSIPFDFIRIVQLLDVEPQAPRFQGNIDLVIYDWNVDIDFSDFDEQAEIIRNIEFVAFIIGLIIATRSVMHVY